MGSTPVNAALGKLHGRIDDYVFREVENKTFVARRSRGMTVPPTAAQLEIRQRFLRAAEYAKAVCGDPLRKPWYVAKLVEKNIHPRRLFGVIVRDFYEAPEVVDIVHEPNYQRRIGDKIRIVATDDLAVESVHVKLTQQDGTLIEQGPAVYVGPDWFYTATVAAPAGVPLVIVATATDHAGNTGALNMGVGV